MHRFFVDDLSGGEAVLVGDDVLHLRRVLRLKIGDAVTLSDGRGTDADGVIARADDASVRFLLQNKRPSGTEPRVPVTLFQGFPKQGKLETIIQKCTELGIVRIVPVETARCVALPGSDFEKKRVRLQRVALEAAKQSRRGVIPEVSPAIRLADCDFSPYALTLAAYEDERAVTLKAALRSRPAPASVALVVGPEGGFAPEEVAQLLEKGAVAVSLGARILRTETAGMAMLAQVLYEVEG